MATVEDTHTKAGPVAASQRTFALVGNPNSGKTTLFNALTGLRSKVGNYAGVTVEKKVGICWSQHGKPMQVIDLPGSYSLDSRSPDEAITQQILLGKLDGAPDAIICVLDATNLERNLFLATHVLELGLPTIVVLNMYDETKRLGIEIDVKLLEQRLGCPVLPVSARSGEGIMQLRLLMSRSDLPISRWQSEGPELWHQARRTLTEPLRKAAKGDSHNKRAEAEAAILLGGTGKGNFAPEAIQRAREWQTRLDIEVPTWRSDLISRRYANIGELCQLAVVRTDPNKKSTTEKLDDILVHPVLGWFVLIGVMLLVFYSVFSWAAPLMDFIDGTMGSLGEWVANVMPEGLLTDLLVDGVIAGIGGVVIFLPQILILFFIIGLLESTGYMARAAFMLDRVMAIVGLHGRSFIPLLSSYACAIPGIMATRTIESPKDRLVTILVAPFMSCAARLPVYVALISVLTADSANPWEQTLLMALMYFLGTAAAFGFAWLFKQFIMKDVSPGVIMELPPYRTPPWKTIFIDLLDRAKVFLKKAGTVILALSIVLWFLSTFPRAEQASPAEQLQQSYAGQIGQFMEPVFQPLGYDWKINIGVLASFAAREVFVSTMAIVYSVEDEEDTESIVKTLAMQQRPDGTAVFTPRTTMSLLVFFVFAMQCMSTVAVTKRETNSWRWALFQLGYMTGFAYIAALAVYQIGGLLGFA